VAGNQAADPGAAADATRLVNPMDGGAIADVVPKHATATKPRPHNVSGGSAREARPNVGTAPVK
jgi:hypothetical protein